MRGRGGGSETGDTHQLVGGVQHAQHLHLDLSLRAVVRRGTERDDAHLDGAAGGAERRQVPVRGSRAHAAQPREQPLHVQVVHLHPLHHVLHVGLTRPVVDQLQQHARRKRCALEQGAGEHRHEPRRAALRYPDVPTRVRELGRV
ncbi:unnamed protein product [Pieris brassicae]|uniref:Uncharacterized protein n=1 Tax=Pieris brassicae TaxID=7116 RepID=A0A9P0X6P0_PIEBR|nr:unnamed protein product [Pieris brassicae]